MPSLLLLGVGGASGGDTVAPTITSSNTASVSENSTLSHSLTASESVSWSIVGGADQAKFEISGSTLRWTSNGTKNYEAPDDANTDNAYVVTVRATDLASNTTDQTITVTVTDVSDDALDGWSSVTVALSASRRILSSYGAGALYHLTSSAVDTANNQIGSNNFAQSTSGRRPVISAAGPQSRDAFDFDGSDDFLDSATALSNFLANNAYYFAVTFILDSAASNNANIYDNHGILADVGSAFFGLYVKHPSGNTAQLYNWDGSADVTPATPLSLSTGVVYTIDGRHESGNIYARLSSGGSVGSWGTGVASGNTSTITGNLRLAIGRNVNPSSGNVFDGKIFEVVMSSNVQNDTLRDAYVLDAQTRYA